MFKVAIVGGQFLKNYESFRKKCIFYLKNKAKEGVYILSTGDEFVNKFAVKYKIDVEIFSADFKKFGKNALAKRNDKMLENCNAVIIFNPDLKEHKFLSQMAIEKNIPVRNVRDVI